MLNLVYFAILGLLIGRGFYQGLMLSIETYTQQGIPCPSSLDIPVCYIVTLAYFLQLLALVVTHRKSALSLFVMGWLPVFLIAFSASIFQYLQGGICPLSPTGFPLCYISLMISSSIFIIAILKLRRYQSLTLNISKERKS